MFEYDPTPIKSSSNLITRVQELEATVESFQKLLEVSRMREKKLVEILRNKSATNDLEMQNPGGEYTKFSLEVETPFWSNFIERGGWLIGLLAVQSLSSYVLIANEKLLTSHPSIIYFLTMLVGAGGNAGNQAAVRVIRGIALGLIHDKNMKIFIYQEMFMAILLSVTLGCIGLIRTFFSPTTPAESFVISFALMTIVFISIVSGCLLPFLLQFLKIDPVHSSTSIQVIMDIAGVLFTCVTAQLLLHSPVGNLIIYGTTHLPTTV
jgi:Mg/Co/Ni transporter MgtE